MQSISPYFPPPSLLQQLCEASKTGDLEQVKLLLAQRPLLGPLQPALTDAASANQVGIVSYLLDQGLFCDLAVVKAATAAGSTDVLQALLDHGWDINQNFGLTGGPALARSSVLRNERLLTWFLTHGASPNQPTTTGRTALDVAAAIASPQVMELLLEHGGDFKKTNALYCALRSPRSGRYEMVEYLLDAGVEINAIEHAGTYRIYMRASDGYGTALHYAARGGHEKIVHLLLERGADKGILDTSNRTAAEVAEEAGHPELVPALFGREKI